VREIKEILQPAGNIVEQFGQLPVCGYGFREFKQG
jgi:hypothetical protein